MLVDNGVASAQQLNTLLLDNESALKTLVANLVTVSAIQAVPVRLNGLRYILTIYPSTVYDGFKPAPGDGKAHFAIDGPNRTRRRQLCDACLQPNEPRLHRLAEWQQQRALRAHQHQGVCVVTAGPASSKGTATIKAKFNAFCNPNSPSYTAGSDVRGAQNAPRPPGDTTAFPAGLTRVRAERLARRIE